MLDEKKNEIHNYNHFFLKKNNTVIGMFCFVLFDMGKAVILQCTLGDPCREKGGFDCVCRLYEAPEFEATKSQPATCIISMFPMF